MVTVQAAPSREASHLRQRLAQMQETIRIMEEERDLLIQRRRRRLIILGASFSLLIHIGLLMYLSTMHRGHGGGMGGPTKSVFAMSILSDDELSEGAEGGAFDDLAIGPANADEAPPSSITDLDAASPAVGIESTTGGNMPPLGATGGTGSNGPGGGGSGGGGLGLGGGGGGGGGTSFFGIATKGTRFCFIVDVSGSMGEDRKLETAMRELSRSIESLPDYAYFHVLLFSSDFVEPPMQKGWTRARKAMVNQYIHYFAEVSPGGGTQPKSAFMQAFSLDVRPDVIFFLTDGQIEGFTADEVAELNGHGKKAVINTIAFGDPSSQDMLKQIASQSGGLYRFVSSSGGP